MHQPPLRIGQAAEILGVSVDTMRRWAEDGTMKTTRSDGGQRLIAVEHEERFNAFAPQHDAEHLGEGDVVVDDEHATFHERAIGPTGVLSLLAMNLMVSLLPHSRERAGRGG